jgi:hypothetical protein
LCTDFEKIRDFQKKVLDFRTARAYIDGVRQAQATNAKDEQMSKRIEGMGRKLEALGFERIAFLVEENEENEGEELVKKGAIYRYKTNLRAEIRVDDTTIGHLERNFSNLSKVFSA